MDTIIEVDERLNRTKQRVSNLKMQTNGTEKEIKDKVVTHQSPDPANNSVTVVYRIRQVDSTTSSSRYYEIDRRFKSRVKVETTGSY